MDMQIGDGTADRPRTIAAAIAPISLQISDASIA